MAETRLHEGIVPSFRIEAGHNVSHTRGQRIRHRHAQCSLCTKTAARPVEPSIARMSRRSSTTRQRAVPGVDGLWHARARAQDRCGRGGQSSAVKAVHINGAVALGGAACSSRGGECESEDGAALGVANTLRMAMCLVERATAGSTGGTQLAAVMSRGRKLMLKTTSQGVQRTALFVSRGTQAASRASSCLAASERERQRGLRAGRSSSLCRVSCRGAVLTTSPRLECRAGRPRERRKTAVAPAELRALVSTQKMRARVKLTGTSPQKSRRRRWTNRRADAGRPAERGPSTNAVWEAERTLRALRQWKDVLDKSPARLTGSNGHLWTERGGKSQRSAALGASPRASWDAGAHGGAGVNMLRRRGTPVNAMLLQACITSTFVVLGGGFRTLLSFAVVAFWAFYFLTVRCFRSGLGRALR
ncbi:hypothetical protein FA95DRAFT_1617432, partial [Auriscalpium vulgare]